jgi:hypothetical protein
LSSDLNRNFSVYTVSDSPVVRILNSEQLFVCADSFVRFRGKQLWLGSALQIIFVVPPHTLCVGCLHDEGSYSALSS